MDEKTLNALVNAIKNKDPKGLKAYENLLKIASSKPKNEEEQKNIEAAKGYVAEIKKRLTAKAAHGVKLNYIKTLKHICPEGLELYYYKQGGNLQCGCKGKKMEEGAKVEEAKCGAVAKFKKVKKAETGILVNNQQKRKRTQEELKRIDELSMKDYFEGTNNNSDNPLDNEAMSLKFIKKYEALKKQQLSLSNQRRTEPLEPKPKPRLNSSKSSKGDSSHVNKLTSLLKKGGAVDTFKAKCGSKMKKHKLGGSLNRIPFYLGGTSKGGITEKSDNTRVQRIPNNGEGVYEQIPVNGWNFVPIVGTLKEAKMLDQGDQNASITRFGISLAGDLAGAGMIGSVAKAAGKVGRIQKALKARGYQLFTKDGSLWFRLPKKIIRGYGDKLYTYEIPNIYGGSSFKTIPTVDYTPAVMAPLVLTLRVPAEAPFFNYSKK